MNPKLRVALVGGWMGITSLGIVGLLAERAMSDPRNAVFDTVSVQRLNVAEPDGKPRVIIANKTHMPGIYMGGKYYEHFHRKAGGFLFFNDEGDEVGGLIFDNNRKPGEAAGGSALTMDQYHQDETLTLTYDHDGKGRHDAGLTVYDRPDWSVVPLLEISDRISKARTPEERKAAEAEFQAFVKSHDHALATRLFAGKEKGDALLRLADRQGRPRLVLKVAPDGDASIEMLDEAGRVTRRIAG